jgi:hypothetical protein
MASSSWLVVLAIFAARKCGTAATWSMTIWSSHTLSQWPTASTIRTATLSSEDGSVVRCVYSLLDLFSNRRLVQDKDDDHDVAVVVAGVETARRSAAAELDGPNIERDGICACTRSWPSSSSVETGNSMDLQHSLVSVMSPFTMTSCGGGQSLGDLPSRKDNVAEEVSVVGIETAVAPLRAPRICSSSCAKSSHKPRKLADTSIVCLEYAHLPLSWGSTSCHKDLQPKTKSGRKVDEGVVRRTLTKSLLISIYGSTSRFEFNRRKYRVCRPLNGPKRNLGGT